jgi:hypothetical protein
MLASKVEMVLRNGQDAAIATQFCFDARQFIRWLDSTRHALSTVVSKVQMGGQVERGESGANSRRITYHLGVFGPTPSAKLKRIASICEVPSLFLGSAFDVIDTDRDGRVSESELLRAAAMLGIGTEQLRLLYKQHCGADGLLRRAELAEVIAEIAIEESHHLQQHDAASDCNSDRSSANVSNGHASLATDGPELLQDGPQLLPAPHSVSGPSTMVSEATELPPLKPAPTEKGGTAGAAGGESGAEVRGGISTTQDSKAVLCPEELVLAIAAYCERAAVPAGEVVLHFFPFGGVSRSTQLIQELRHGTWPPGFG